MDDEAGGWFLRAVPSNRFKFVLGYHSGSGDEVSNIDGILGFYGL